MSNNSSLSVYSAPQTGNVLCHRLEMLVTVAVATQKVIKFAKDNGEDLLCSGTTIAVGINQIWQGNYGTGAGMTAIGVKKFISTCRSSNSDGKIARLLNDANASIDMIRTLEGANKQSFAVVDKNLDLVGQNVKKLNIKLAEIKSIATDGLEELEEQKKQATQLYKETGTLFSKAQELFSLSQKSLNGSTKLFSTSLKKFDKLLKLTNIDKFVDLAKEIRDECQKAQTSLEAGDQNLQEGISILEQAIAKQEAASQAAGKAIQMSANRFELIKQRAKIKQSYEQRIEQTQEELRVIQARNGDKENLLSDVKQDVVEAEELVKEAWGNASCLFGMATAVAAAPTTGFTGGVAAGYAGAAAFHNRNKIMTAIFGSSEDLKPVEVPAGQVIDYRFDSKSSGFWGRFIEKRPQSWTKGTVGIKLDEKETLSFRFNLNDKSKISKQDLFKLQQRLMDKLERREISTENARRIIRELETISIERGSKHCKSKGFIQECSTFFAEIRRLLARQ